MTDLVNDHEIRVIALKRSGHHAIIQWMYANVGGGYLFLNQCTPGANPFDLMHIRKRPDRRFVSDIEGITADAECGGLHRRKAALIYNYEHHPLEPIAAPVPTETRDAWVGASARRTDVIALRDPFNNLASLLRVYYDGTKYSVWLLLRSVQLWKQYAREALGETSLLPGHLLVDYNRWFTDDGYKAEVAQSLGLSGAGAGLQEVAKWGSTSSFDGTSLDGAAATMKVLDRWRHFADDPLYRRLIADEELWALCEQLHGLPEGVDALRSRATVGAQGAATAQRWLPCWMVGKTRQLRWRWNRRSRESNGS